MPPAIVRGGHPVEELASEPWLRLDIVTVSGGPLILHWEAVHVGLGRSSTGEHEHVPVLLPPVKPGLMREHS